MEKITIGLLCYNSQDTVARALNSALKQDWPDYEVVVVDDASTDETVKLVEMFTEKASRVRLIRQPSNTGIGGARNTVVQAARGDVIVFFDDDDESAPNRLRLQYQQLKAYESENPGVLVACYASGERKYANGYSKNLVAIGSRPGVPVGSAVADYLLLNERKPDLFYGSGVPASAMMVRTSTINLIGGFDARLRRAEDVDFAIRLALKGGHFIGCKESLYTQYATMASDKSPTANLDAELFLLKKHKGYLDQKKLYSYAQKWFIFRYHHFSGNRILALTSLATCWLGNPIRTTRHLLASGPRRWLHERQMNQASKI
jgi:glycosyltransferase involved in cell wall biosynthesis